MYKKRYFLAFYDKTGEEFITCFDSVYEIARYLNIDYSNKKAINKIYTDLNYALKNNSTINILKKLSSVFLIY